MCVCVCVCVCVCLGGGGDPPPLLVHLAYHCILSFCFKLVNLGHHSNHGKRSSADQLWAHMHDEHKVKGGQPLIPIS